METTTIFTTILALVVVFLFAVQKFGRQVRRVAGERFKLILLRFTSNPLKAVVSGAFITSVLQSSTATSVILVSIVNAGLIPSFNAIGVVIGANIGTTITAQLVALKMTYIAPIVVIFGFILTHTHSKLRRYGKAIFYFGIIFLSLFIISLLIEPLKDKPSIIEILKSVESPYSAILIGAIMTAILQSSSVFTGLVIILAVNGLVSLPVAVGLMYGTNIGTPVTAIIASTSASFDAKKVAIAHALFNIAGVLLFLPLTSIFLSLLHLISSETVQQIVNAHFLFNVICALICLTFFKKYERLVSKVTLAIYGDKK